MCGRLVWQMLAWGILRLILTHIAFPLKQVIETVVLVFSLILPSELMRIFLSEASYSSFLKTAYSRISMRTLKQVEVAQVAGAATTYDTGFLPKTGISFIDAIHANEYKTIYKPLLQLFGLVKKTA